jgi:hypothetical protein
LIRKDAIDKHHVLLFYSFDFPPEIALFLLGSGRRRRSGNLDFCAQNIVWE